VIAMTASREARQRERQARYAADYAAKYPALAKRRSRRPLAAQQPNLSVVSLGTDQDGRLVFLDDQTRLRHLKCQGATGSGKTTLLKHMILQDIRRGRGGAIFDPHGSHPGSLLHELQEELEADGFFETGRFHFIDPNLTSHITPFNFLGLEDTDSSVIADAFLEAVSVVFKGEDLFSKPTIRSKLRTIVIALRELHLPVSDALLLLDPYDHSGIRSRAIERIPDAYAREELRQLDFISKDRSKHDFRAEVVGPLNRLAEFLSCEAVRMMLGVVDVPGEKRHTLDLLTGMNRGDVYFINLQHGPAISEANASLIGALMLRYFFLLASRRTNLKPFFITIDECQKFLSGDVPNLLAESRKFGIGLTLSHQYLGQLGTPDTPTYQACMNCVDTDIVFKVNDPREAQILAEKVLPLNLERPVAASVRPTVTGHRRVRMASGSVTHSEAVTEGEGETIGEMDAHTDMHSESEAIGTFSTTMTGSATMESMAESSGMVLSPPLQLFAPSAPNATALQYPLSESLGNVSSRGSSDHSASGEGTNHATAESRGTATTYARSRASSRSIARSRGTARTSGESEAFESLYQDLPSAWHSLESERYRAGEVLRALPIGRCIVRIQGRTVAVTVPPPRRQS
jgi:hypothetical protein